MREETRTVQRERCAVSDTCDGACREGHMTRDGRVKCIAWFVEVKEYKTKRGKGTQLRRSYRDANA